MTTELQQAQRTRCLSDWVIGSGWIIELHYEWRWRAGGSLSCSFQICHCSGFNQRLTFVCTLSLFLQRRSSGFPIVSNSFPSTVCVPSRVCVCVCGPQSTVRSEDQRLEPDALRTLANELGKVAVCFFLFFLWVSLHSYTSTYYSRFWRLCSGSFGWCIWTHCRFSPSSSFVLQFDSFSLSLVFALPFSSAIWKFKVVFVCAPHSLRHCSSTLFFSCYCVLNTLSFKVWLAFVPLLDFQLASRALFGDLIRWVESADPFLWFSFSSSSGRSPITRQCPTLFQFIRSSLMKALSVGCALWWMLCNGYVLQFANRPTSFAEPFAVRSEPHHHVHRLSSPSSVFCFRF